MTMPTWVSEVQAFGVIFTGLGAGVIAWQQYRIAKRKLRYDLYGKRYSVFCITMESIISALNNNFDKIVDERTKGMSLSLREARFLFDAATFDLLNNIETEVLSYRHEVLAINKPNFRQWSEAQSFTVKHHETGKKLFSYMRRLPYEMHSFLQMDDNLSFSFSRSAETNSIEQSKASDWSS